MLITDQKPLEILNNLIVVNNDRMQGYHYAARETDASILKELFSRLQESSWQFKTELCREVYKLGAAPVEGNVASPDFFKAWMDVMTAIGKGDHKAILNSCVYEEGVVLKKYEEALLEEDEHITTQQHLLFNKQHHLLLADNEKVKNLFGVLVKER
jgi:uncharacterized protein (TIGR02284 family)